MAKSYTNLKAQFEKIRSATEGLTPPEPDDEFEDLRRALYPAFDRMKGYLDGRISGDGSMQSPSVE